MVLWLVHNFNIHFREIALVPPPFRRPRNKGRPYIIPSCRLSVILCICWLKFFRMCFYSVIFSQIIFKLYTIASWDHPECVKEDGWPLPIFKVVAVKLDLILAFFGHFDFKYCMDSIQSLHNCCFRLYKVGDKMAWSWPFFKVMLSVGHSVRPSIKIFQNVLLLCDFLTDYIQTLHDCSLGSSGF